MTTDAQALLDRLETVLASYGPLALAVSGGVDSMTLAAVACRHDARSQVFHALSPAVPRAATERVRRYAERHGWQLACIDAGEMNDPRYRANPGNRCYYCKSNLYRALHGHTSLKIAAGTNTDDLGDYRPGLQAAREQDVVHPLVEAGIDKKGVRMIARHLGLHELADLPASPCLSSRVTTGIAIDADLLPLIDRTEQRLRAALKLQGASDDLRCRIQNGGIAIETGAEAGLELQLLVRKTVEDIFAGTRFTHYARKVSIAPYRRGSAFIHEQIA